ncbi:MAG: hypothetical protein SGI73_04970 [Chloroflexota bacterium]|nr:hypothetical protein [Chloroflexota bacterium]
MRVSVTQAVWGWIVRVLEGLLSHARARLHGQMASEPSTRERDFAPDARQREFDAPAHWLEHATPRPPADWIRMVADKAPYLLDRVDPRYVRSILKAPLPALRTQQNGYDPSTPDPRQTHIQPPAHTVTPKRPAYRIQEVTSLTLRPPLKMSAEERGRETARREHDPMMVERQTVGNRSVRHVPTTANDAETVAHIESNPPTSIPLATPQRRAFVPFRVHEHTGHAADVQPLTTAPDRPIVQPPRSAPPDSVADVQPLTTARNPVADIHQVETAIDYASAPEPYLTRPLETEQRMTTILASQALDTASIRAVEGKWASLPDVYSDPVEAPDTVRRHRAKLDSEQRGVEDFWNE